MEVKLPHRFEDLKLRHLMVLHSVSDGSERISQITGMPMEEVLRLPVAVLDRASSHCEDLVGAEVGQHPKRVSVAGNTMGFIPDWSQFTTGEWIDMERYTQDLWANAHKIMSLLYRPVSNEVGDRYSIQPYNAKEDPDVWLDSPATWFVGALVFFSTSRSRLLSSMQRSLAQATELLIESARSGDGTTSSISLRERITSRWTGSRRRRLKSYSSTSPTSKTFTT